MPARAAKPAIPKTAAEIRKILATLSTQHPGADTELNFRNAYELLVATILSAQCTDERVNQVTPALFKRYPDARVIPVTPALFKRYPDARALARASTDELEPQIQSTGFFRAKSRALLGMATGVVERHGGRIPKTMDELVSLPGVGRKTANVVLGHALGVPGLPVDRHVLRVTNRIGLVSSEDPEIVEQQLGAALPPQDWTRASDTLILHGRRICKPKPLCPQCVVRPDCLYYRTVTSKFAAPVRRFAAKEASSGRVARRRSENGKPAEQPRAPKARATGRGGGAPRQPRR